MTNRGYLHGYMKVGVSLQSATPSGFHPSTISSHGVGCRGGLSDKFFAVSLL